MCWIELVKTDESNDPEQLNPFAPFEQVINQVDRPDYEY